jgi:lipid A 3-O-deacylase
MSRLFVVFAILSVIVFASVAYADDGRLMVTEENDKFASLDDRHYTQGILASWQPGNLAVDSKWQTPFNWLASNTPLLNGNDFKRQYDWEVLGQSIFTPQAIHTPNPPPTDRPYGAWLYTGASLLQQTKLTTHDTLENTEVLAGIVGPLALGSIVQNDFHQFIGVQPAEGWHNQIHNEPGITASYERKWRFETPLNNYFSADAIPETGATVGNVFTYGEASAMVRIGHNIAADYGSKHIRPGLSGTGWFDEDALQGKIGWYFFLGTQGRAVGHNIFLDGNTWRTSASVNKRPIVADFVGGFSLLWSHSARLDFAVTERTKEFYGQGSPDRFGSVDLAVGF